MDDKTLVEVTEADKRAAQNAFDSVAWGCPDSEMWCFVQAFATHRIEAAKAEGDMLRGTLEHIIEYWNRDQNKSAMADALWHIIETASDALSAIKEQYHD